MSDLLGGLVIISAGTLYPAYSSYKAVKTKNTREYVKWMMYWIVFAFFNAITLFTDVFISWFPGYYLFKTLFILWLVSPATRGSTYLYKKVVHPTLKKNEERIDVAIENIKDRGYDYTAQWARLAMQNFSRALMEAVFKGQVLIADQMQRQYMQQGNVPAAVTTRSGNVVTDGREVEQLNHSSEEGRLYRVDSQMFEMDDDFIDLSAEVAEDTQQSSARQRHKKRKPRPMSMPPATIEEHHPLGDETFSDPDHTPFEEETRTTRRKHRRSKATDEIQIDIQTDTQTDSQTDTPQKTGKPPKQKRSTDTTSQGRTSQKSQNTPPQLPFPQFTPTDRQTPAKRGHVKQRK